MVRASAEVCVGERGFRQPPEHMKEGDFAALRRREARRLPGGRSRLGVESLDGSRRDDEIVPRARNQLRIRCR